MDNLKNIRIVLIEPSHPGNIGAVARSMKTMGLQRLTLVNPKKFPHSEATKRAAGAESVLLSAQVAAGVKEAIADCNMVLGTSVRDREVSWPTHDPRVAASMVEKHFRRSHNGEAGCCELQQVAILFGRESSGLTNEELDLCESQIRIPANIEYSSLNLASAVQIIAYELRMAVIKQNPLSEQRTELSNTTAAQRRQLKATQTEKEGHMQHLRQTLEQLQFIKAKPATMLMRKLTRLYNKAELTVEEIQILRGILTAIQSREKGSRKLSEDE